MKRQIPMASPVPATRKPTDTETPGQDVNDQIWLDGVLEPPATDAEGTELRVNHGGLDLLQHVVEEVEEWVERETTHGAAHKPRVNPGDAPVLSTVIRAAQSWRGTTYAVDKEERVVTARPDRFRVLVTNCDATNVVYLSHDTQGSGGNPQQNVISLFPKTTREFFTQGEIYAYPFLTGTAQQVDVHDEYGYPQ